MMNMNDLVQRNDDQAVSRRRLAKIAVTAFAILAFGIAGLSGALAHNSDGWDDDGYEEPSGGSGWYDDGMFASGGSGGSSGIIWDDDWGVGSGGSGGSGWDD
jgi:hypothetical protein